MNTQNAVIASHIAVIGTMTVEAFALADGRKRILVGRSDRALSDYNPHPYSTVSNIDGSNRFMCERGYWSFMPDELCRHPAVEAALDGLPKQADAHINAYHWHNSVSFGPSSFA